MLDPHRLGDLVSRARREVDEGLLPSCQLAVAHDGEIVVSATHGDATDDTRYVIFSATKPILASAAWVLIGEGMLDPSAKVADLVPEFATNGKDVVTVEQVMLHTSGFPWAPLHPKLWNHRQGRLERFGDWRLNWEPGTRFEYHATSAHWVLAEIVERLGAGDFRRVVHERVIDRLGLATMQLGVEPEDQGDIATLVTSGEPPSADELEAVLGIRELPILEATDHALMQFNEPGARRAGVPGGGAVASAPDVARFYQALLHNPDGLWDPDVLADVTGNVRTTLVDPMLGVPANRSLGLVVAGDDGHAAMRHNFGRTVSGRAFGHAGAGGQIAWADPATGISFCYLTNGLDANVLREGRRGVALSSRAGALADD